MIKEKYVRFEYYLRQCNECGDIFKTIKKRGKYCKDCNKERNVKRICNILISRGIIQTIEEGIKKYDLKNLNEVRRYNGINKLDSNKNTINKISNWS